MQRFTGVAKAALVAAGATLVLAPTASAKKDPNRVSQELRSDLKVSKIRKHQQALQDIATLNGGNRAAGTPGYDMSVKYVVRQLKKAGYKPQIQPFAFKAFEVLAPSQLSQISPDPTTYTDPEQFSIMSYSGSGDVTGTIQGVDLTLPPTPAPSSTSGCEAADFAGFTAGNIALIQRGTCTFGAKAENAQAAGASAVVIMNEGQPGRDGPIAGTLGEDTTAVIPVVGTSFAVGEDLASPAGTTVRVVTSTKITPTEASNVIADLAPKSAKKAGKTVLLGAHLDSVPEGPGINDNGSGTATDLEIAIQMAKNKKPRNPVRFAFWGAEEAGLVGSTYYVSQLTEEEGAKIGLNLNFDMVGSPNFVRFVYDGDGDAFGTAGPAGSDHIEHTFLDYFASKGQATDPTAFDGRSDYKPFIDVGIPAGGLFSGAEGIKTAEQTARYGGVTGEAYDRCYHQACDTFSNVSIRGLRTLSQGAAHATAVYAAAKELFGASSAQRTKARKAGSSKATQYHGHALAR